MPHDDPAAPIEPSVEVVPVTPAHVDTLTNLFQLYQYEFSEIEGTDISEDGRFHQLDAVDFDHAYIIRTQGKLAGFALLRRQPSKLKPENDVWWMQEFFIMRRYWRKGIGRTAACLVIDRHPGAWEITETPNNFAAIEFWRRVLRAYGCEESTYEDGKWGTRPLQWFSHP